MDKIFFRHCLLTGILFFCFVTQNVFAQVSFIFNAGAFGKDMKGLATVQLINTSGLTYTGILDAEIKSLSGSQPIVRIQVHSLNINPGNNVISPARFSSASTFYSESMEGKYLKQTGLMPDGELEYCFRFTVTSKNSNEEMYEGCFTGENISGSPMELITPDDNDKFCNKRPCFSWQPPLPLTADMVYSLKLVELNANQSRAEALLINTPVIFQTGIKGFTLAYPTGIPDLKEDKSYVWQVTAYTKARQTVSEIWAFSIECPQETKDSLSYRELRAQDDGGFLSTGRELRFAVYNAYIPGSLKYTITNLENADKKLKGMPAVQLQKGINDILIDLNKIAGMEDENEYLLNVWLPDGKKVSVRFKYTDE